MTDSSTPPAALLDSLTLLDWWEGKRWSASVLCHDECTRLQAHVREAVEALSLSDFVTGTSAERTKIETYMEREIGRIAMTLAESIASDLAGDAASPPLSPQVDSFSGMTAWDWAKAAVGVGAGGALAFAGARAAPGLLATVGLAAIAAPAAIALTLGGLAWSAYAGADGKRDAYRDALLANIDRLLTGEDDSVLARHLAIIDDIFRTRSGDLL